MKPFTTIAVVVFSLVSLAHLLRLCFGWEIVMNGWHVPTGVSIGGFVVPAILAAMVWRESRQAG